MEQPHVVDSDPDDSQERCRLLLGDDAADLSDDQIQDARAHADAMARTIVELVVCQHATRSDRS